MSLDSSEERVQKQLAALIRLRRCEMLAPIPFLCWFVALLSIKRESIPYLIISFFVIVLGELGVLVVLDRRVRRGSLVLWIRRFDNEGAGRQNQQFLEGAVSPWGKLITLADSNIKTSAGSRSLTTIAVAFLVISVALAKFGIYSYAATFVGYAIMATCWSRKGKQRINRANFVQRLASVKALSLPARMSGMVWTCQQDSNLWRDVIRGLSPQIEAAVLSASEITPNIQWEIDTLKASIGINKIIVFARRDKARALLSSTLQEIEAPESSNWLKDYWISYVGAAWRRSSLTVLRAIESEKII